jgi:ABC-type transport system involved in cytochrome c biogenesis permease component
MLRVLLAKDLRRAWRNPVPWLINLVVPLCITALIGLAFGGKSEKNALGHIRFAVVDEDNSPLTGFLRGAMNQGEAGKHFEPVYLKRDEALRQVNDNKLSAVVIIPTNFTRNYLTGSEPVKLELIKNPAQSIHPAVLEELLGAVVTAMNAIARNFQSEFPEWLALFEGKGDYHKVAALIERAGDKLRTANKYINPPLVSYEQEASTGDVKSGPSLNLFAYLLAGLCAMFLLFLAGNGMNDLQRELRQRTLERYHTLHQQLLPFVISKTVSTVALLLMCSAVMLGGGALIFRIHWQQPFVMVALTVGYTAFAAGLMAVIVALVPDERRAGAFTAITGMALGLAGGCAFPPQQLPAFLRQHITPFLPSFWYADTVRNLEFGTTTVPWGFVLLKLAGLSALLIGLATLLFRQRFKRGLRA